MILQLFQFYIMLRIRFIQFLIKLESVKGSVDLLGMIELFYRFQTLQEYSYSSLVL